MRKPIRNISSFEHVQERLFDALIDNNGDVMLEFKIKKKIVTVPWSDIIYQVENLKKLKK